MFQNYAYPRSAIATMYAGLALTIVAIATLYVDHATGNVLAGHIRAGYPSYSASRIDGAAAIYLGYLTALGAVGILCWLGTIRAARTGKRWARPVATAIFAIATAVALTNLLIRDTDGATGLPPLLGWIGVLPCLAGLLAVGLLWKRSPARA